MALSEIEKLERRYAENPQGLTFAPLAEVLRKNGDVARALELLRSGLELHPNYIPASIVLGRCQLDLSDLPAAEAAFTHVLALDGENVIALKALADVSERQHHFDQAERWLRTLLSVDRSNDEARAQLERIANARRDSEAAPPPPALDAEASAIAAPEEVPPVESAVTASGMPAPDAPALAAFAPPPPPLEPAPVWASSPEGPEAEEAMPLPLADLETEFTRDGDAAPPVEPIAGLVGRDVEGQEPEQSEFKVEQSEDIVLRSAGGHEFQVPDASLELSHRVAPPAPASPFGDESHSMFSSLEEAPARRENPSPEEVPVPAEQAVTAEAGAPAVPAWEPPAAEVVASAPDAPVEPELVESLELEQPLKPAESPAPAPAEQVEPVVLSAPEPEAASEQALPPPEPPSAAPLSDVIVAPEPEPIVTETMAEVLLQQGHPVEALQVYRELEVRSAGDARFRDKISALEEETRSVGPEPEPASASATRRQYTASETGGRSVREFLRSLLAERPPMVASAPVAPRAAIPQPPGETSGAPTRPAADALSLSSVFGEETTPLPPAVPAGGAPVGGVSFDEFYSPAGQGGASSKPRSPDPKNDDLDQFHAWLQNLKR